MSTLCCGNACHLNCMAKWLSTQSAQPNTCPQCRSELPSLPKRMRIDAQVNANASSSTGSSALATEREGTCDLF
jgi:hypothetical protein